MILWCTKCREFRKRNTPDWQQCRYSSRHTMVSGHERMENEMRQIRERIAGAGKPGDGPAANARLIMAAPEGMPKKLHALEGRVLRYCLPPMEDPKTGGEIACEFRAMLPHLLYEIFDLLRRAFRDPEDSQPATRMVDFEAVGRAVARHAGHGAGEFDGALRRAAGEASDE